MTQTKVKASDIFATIDEALAVANLPQEDYARIAKYEEDAVVLRSTDPGHNYQALCPRCGSPLQQATSISGSPSTDWLECSNSVCNTYVDTYRPMPHQAAVHKDSHRIIGNFGSYGTGKTKTSEKEIEKHIFLTPDANILLGANITSQYEQTLLRDFEKSFPIDFLEGRSQQKGYLDFINGARLMLRPFDDPDKLRSNNYSLVVMLEASEINADAFHQLKTRLRNTAATYTNNSTTWDWRKLICESNPDSGKHIKSCPSINIPLIHLKA